MIRSTSHEEEVHPTISHSSNNEETISLIEHGESFEKRLDTQTGTFIYQLKSTDFITRDVPYGINIQLSTAAPQQIDPHPSSSSRNSPWSKEVRRDMIDAIRREHAKKKEKELRVSTLREKERHTQIWRDACERGRTNGHILVCGENLGYIWDELKDLESTFSIPLVSLSLIGHGLETCDHVGQKVKRLVCLNLSSNKIHSIDDSMGTLTSLMELNLSHNNLERLPDCIGNLQQLQELNLAHNLLTALPSTFIQLCNLRRLTVEHNQIRQLAFYIGNWKACCELNINNNCLIMLPTSISELPLLERLLVNDNYLQSLPTELCQLQSIKVLHASRNLLVSIPDNIGNLTSLESLWLDFNKLSSIPHGFHGLVNLCDLRLEGNVDMVHPPMDVIQYGAESVKKWSETRLVISMKDRQRHIITALQDILNQVGIIGLRNEQGERVDVSSMYQKDVQLNGEIYYQFLDSALFDTFIRLIFITWAQLPEEDEGLRGFTRSFPYKREETQEALRDYEDVTGKVYIQHPKCRFRRCCCVDLEGKKKVCVPPAFGWMCERPAVMLKAHLVTGRNQEQRRRMKVEADRLNSKVQLAKKMAQIYLSSDEGRTSFRKAAYNELLLRISNNHGPMDKNDSEKNLDISRRLLWSQSLRRQLNEIEEKLRSDFILKEIDRAQDEAKSENERMSKIVELWKGASVDKFFVAWLKVTRRKKRQNMRIGMSMANDSIKVTETNNSPVETSMCAHSSMDQSSFVDTLEDIDVKQERILAATRILRAKKG